MIVKILLIVNIIYVKAIRGDDESINCYICHGCIDVKSEDIGECRPWVPDDLAISTEITTESHQTTAAVLETTTQHQETTAATVESTTNHQETTSGLLEPSTESQETTDEVLDPTTATEKSTAITDTTDHTDPFAEFEIISALEETHKRTRELEIQEMEEWIVNDGFIPVRLVRHRRSIIDEKMVRKFEKNRNEGIRPPRCATVYYQENGLLNVTRGCAYESDDHRRRCLDVLGTDDDNILSCRLCEDDLCNSATNLAGPFTVITLGLLVYASRY